jgi:D-aminopeptidase
VLKFLSVNTIVIAPAKTGKDNSNKTAVITTDQPNKANLCNLIPGVLIFAIVVIKFTAPNKLLTPDKCKPNMAKSTLGPL